MKKLALVLAAALSSACFDTTIFDPMERQPKYKPFGANPFFADGRAMRPTPPNTVPRERKLNAPALTAGLDATGAALTQIPVPLTRALLDRGHQRYDIYCSLCHGLLADGESPVARNFSLKPPPSLLDREKREQTVGHYFQVITQGYGLMGNYSSELPAEDRWAVIAYLRAIQLSQSAHLADAPADVQARLAQEIAK